MCRNNSALYSGAEEEQRKDSVYDHFLHKQATCRHSIGNGNEN